MNSGNNILNSNLSTTNIDLNKWYPTLTDTPYPLRWTTDVNGYWQDFNTNTILKSLDDLVYVDIDKKDERTKSLGKPNTKNNEEENNMFNFGKMFNGMFGPVRGDMCKIGVNGQIAVHTSTGYKTYDIKTGKLTNCDNLSFDMNGAFWVVPTFKVNRGDIILVNEKPRCVIEVNPNSIKTFSYENSTIDEIVPERHVFMGKTYCYGKIFSPFMNMDKKENGDLMGNMMNMAMISQMFGGNGNSANNNNMLPFLFMMNNSGSNPFAGMFENSFNFGEETEEDKEE